MVLSLAITGRVACQAWGARQLSDPGTEMWFCRGVSTNTALLEKCAQEFGASSLISWAVHVMSVAAGAIVRAASRVARTYSWVQSAAVEAASVPEQNPRMLPCAPLKAKWPAGERDAKLCLAGMRKSDRVPGDGRSACPLGLRLLSTCAWQPLCGCNMPLSSTQQSTLNFIPNRQRRAAKSCSKAWDWQLDGYERRLRPGRPNCIVAVPLRRSPSVSRYKAFVHEHGTMIACQRGQ
jgi:hypothetical protein